MIHVSLEGLLAPALEGGLSPDAVGSVFPRLERAHGELMTMRGDRVGFLDAPAHTEIVDALLKEAKRLHTLSDDLLVLGIGGSSLGGQAIAHGLAHTTHRGVRVHFLDNVDPDTVTTTLDRLDPTRTSAVVITKSGGTVETLAQLLIVRGWFKASVGQGEARQRTVFVTDPSRGLLRELANAEGIRSFEIPPNIGGRYSVLTPVGLLPAAFLGIDIKAICAGAQSMVERVTAIPDATNPAVAFAAGTLLAQESLGRGQLVMMPYSDGLRLMSSWFVQLWAESLGKRHDRQGKEVFAGQTPIAAVGATDQHAQLQLFVEGPRDKAVVLIETGAFRRPLPIPAELEGREEVAFLHGRDLGELLAAERRATRAALLEASVPVVDIQIPKVEAETLGGLFVLFETACALAGLAAGIDPFDQPGVEAGKRMALGLLGREGYTDAAEAVLSREALARA